MSKYVVTSHADVLTWGPAIPLSGSLKAELATVKAQPGRDILVQGGVTIVGSLIRDHLLDELALLILPIVVGQGQRLFDGSARVRLTLANSETFGNGVVNVTYRPGKERGHLTLTDDLLASEALVDQSLAKTVSVREDRTVVSDGPFPEVKEYLGGFYLVDCHNRERALEIAAKAPDARVGHVEVRPVFELRALDL